jgi:hypothetical protein
MEAFWEDKARLLGKNTCGVNPCNPQGNPRELIMGSRRRELRCARTLQGDGELKLRGGVYDWPLHGYDWPLHGMPFAITRHGAHRESLYSVAGRGE